MRVTSGYYYYYYYYTCKEAFNREHMTQTPESQDRKFREAPGMTNTTNRMSE